jgi:transposase-like protein
LRRRVVLTVLEEGQPRAAVAQRFTVARSTVYRWVDVAVAEGRLAVATGVRLHPWILGRALRRLRLTRKIEDAARRGAGQRAVQAEHEAWREAVAGIPPERLVFLDESAVLTNLVHTHAWSPCGERASGTAPCGSWERVTILGAMNLDGILAAMSIPAATDGKVFHPYRAQVLLPELQRNKPDAVLVMDNLNAHETAAVRALGEAGFAYRYLPRYSPDMNPIEPAWAKVKGPLRKVAARIVEGIHRALGPVLDAISPQDAPGFFRHAGYAGPN